MDRMIKKGVREVAMASKGKTEDGLPKRDRVQGAKNIEATRRKEEMVGFEVGDHTQRPHHPNGWQPGGR